MAVLDLNPGGEVQTRHPSLVLCCLPTHRLVLSVGRFQLFLPTLLAALEKADPSLLLPAGRVNAPAYHLAAVRPAGNHVVSRSLLFYKMGMRGALLPGCPANSQSSRGPATEQVLIPSSLL